MLCGSFENVDKWLESTTSPYITLYDTCRALYYGRVMVMYDMISSIFSMDCRHRDASSCEVCEVCGKRESGGKGEGREQSASCDRENEETSNMCG